MMQKKFLTILFFSWLTYGFSGVALSDNYEKARKAARAFQRPIGVIYVDQNTQILDQIKESDFFDVIKEGIIFVTSQEAGKGACLQLLDSEEREIGRIGDLQLSSRELALHLRTMINGYFSIRKGLNKGWDLTLLYNDAQTVGCTALAEEILEENLKKKGSVKLLLESYGKHPEVSLHDEIIKRGDAATILQLKMIDIQRAMAEHVQPEKIEALAADLLNDDQGWKLCLVLAEYYAKNGRKDLATTKLHEAAKKAPKDKATLIKDSLLQADP